MSFCYSRHFVTFTPIYTKVLITTLLFQCWMSFVLHVLPTSCWTVQLQLYKLTRYCQDLPTLNYTRVEISRCRELCKNFNLFAVVIFTGFSILICKIKSQLSAFYLYKNLSLIKSQQVLEVFKLTFVSSLDTQIQIINFR